MGAIINSGQAKIAQAEGTSTQLVIDRFVFANIEGLNVEAPVDLDQGYPDPSDVVHVATMTAKGYVAADKVVYSCILGPSIGDFQFNWVGLQAADDTLIAVSYTPTQSKYATDGFTVGNTVTRNFLTQYNSAQDITGIDVPAEAWQIDFMNRLDAHDELRRVDMLRLFGPAMFINDGFLVVVNGTDVTVTAGGGYVQGLPVTLQENTIIDTGTLPKDIYLDAVLVGDATDLAVVASFAVSAPASPLTDYIDEGGDHHYLVKIANVESNLAVIDHRQKVNVTLSVMATLFDRATQEDAESGEENTKATTVLRVWQAIAKWWDNITTEFGRGFIGLEDEEEARNYINAAPVQSPEFTGEPTAPTKPTSDFSTGMATTEFVSRASVRPLNSIADLYNFIGNFNGQTIQINSWAPGLNLSGGKLTWISGLNRSNHDGCKVFSPTQPPPPSFFSAADIADYRSGIGDEQPTDVGCWVFCAEDPECSVWSSSSLVKPVRTFSTAKVRELGEVTASYLTLQQNTSLTWAELLIPIDDSIDVVFYIDMDSSEVPTNDELGVHVVAVQCSDLSRTGPAWMSVAVTEISPSLFRCVVTPEIGVSREFMGLSVRIAANADEYLTLRGIKAYQGTKLIGKTFFEMWPNRSAWSSNSRSTLLAGHLAQTMSIGNTGDFVGYNGVTLSPFGRSDMLGDTISLDFFTSVVHPAIPTLQNIRLIKGDYYGYRLPLLISLRGDTNLIAIGGKVRLMCGREMKTDNWTLEQSSPRFVYSAHYDWDSNQDADIRAGTRQPFVSQLVPDNRTTSLIAYKFNPVASIASVNANNYSVFYDYANKKLYFSFDASNTNTFVYVAEADAGVFMGATPRNLNAFNIDIVAGKSDLWHLRPTAYTARRNGGKFISLHDCGGLGSNNENGIRIDNIDHELINFIGDSNANDGLNLHFGGMSYIEGGRTWFNRDDGVSHHEQQFGVVEDHSSRYNAAGNYTPAFGARVYHYRCESISSDILSPKTYSGKMACVSGQDKNTFAYYESCYSDLRETVGSPYHCNAQQTGTKATLIVINPRTRAYSGKIAQESGPGNNIVNQS